MLWQWWKKEISKHYTLKNVFARWGWEGCKFAIRAQCVCRRLRREGGGFNKRRQIVIHILHLWHLTPAFCVIISSKWIFLNPWCSPNHRARSTSEGLFSILSSLTLWRLLLNHYVYTMYSPTSNFVFEQRVGRVLKCLGRRCGEVCPIINFFPFYAFPKCFRF